jgi:hypothetical protein
MRECCGGQPVVLAVYQRYKCRMPQRNPTSIPPGEVEATECDVPHWLEPGYSDIETPYWTCWPPEATEALPGADKKVQR